MNPVVVVHGGGASHISKDRKERVRQGIIRAATVGYNILREGGSAVDAVESAVAVLEDDPEFNAGCGSVLNVNGEVEMDASIMNGKDLSAGAVSAVRCVANPIKLARLVMEKTPHCFLTDQGAAKFAAAMGVPEVPGKQLVTERNIKRLEKEKHEKDAQKLDCQNKPHETVKVDGQHQRHLGGCRKCRVLGPTLYLSTQDLRGSQGILMHTQETWALWVLLPWTAEETWLMQPLRGASLIKWSAE
uniref:Asparaginase and isoaspartyl peptidase 1 n=1 Tax=Equus asinus TaxID=9793 RepID=A0A9L0JL65_EQUAS